MRIRSCLISAVYRKSLVLSSCAKTNTTTGEIVNLMAVDSQTFVELLPFASSLWTSPITIPIALWLLYNELGVAVFGGIAFILLSLIFNIYLGICVKKIKSQLMKIKDQRIRVLNEILNGIKLLKVFSKNF